MPIPLKGDRSARDMAYADLHATDIETGQAVYHLPTVTGVGDGLTWDGSQWVATDLLTAAEHTAIGDATPHHTPITLSTELGAVQSLTGQLLDLTIQVANQVLAGPSTGTAAKPAFRVLTLSDLPICNALLTEEPEYGAGSLILAGTNHNGSLTPHEDTIAQRNAYAWAGHDPDQTVIVLKRWRLPSQFASIGATFTIGCLASNLGGATGAIAELYDTTGTRIVQSALLQATSWTDTILPITGGTWTANGVIMLRFILHADADETVWLGGFQLPYTVHL